MFSIQLSLGLAFLPSSSNSFPALIFFARNGHDKLNYNKEKCDSLLLSGIQTPKSCSKGQWGGNLRSIIFNPHSKDALKFPESFHRGSHVRINENHLSAFF
jgi:hypothetical protein